MSLCGAISINIAKEGIKKIKKKFWNAITLEYHQKLYKLLPQRMAAVIQSKESNTSNGGYRREEKSHKHWSLFTMLLSSVTAIFFVC